MHTPRLTEYEDEATEYESGRRLGHRMVSDSMVMFTACHADPIPSGTKATLVFEPERLPGGPFGKLVARTVRLNYRADLARLKQILEDDNEEEA